MGGFDPNRWQDADPDAGFENSEPPDPGLYEVSVQDARAFESKAGDDILVVEFRVITGPLTGHTWGVVNTFKSEGAVKVAKGMCSRLGVDVDGIGSLDELDTAVKAVLGNYYAVEVKQNGQYRNTYVEAPLSDVPKQGIPGMPDATAPAADDEPVPF